MDWFGLPSNTTQFPILPPDTTCRGEADLFRNSCNIDHDELVKRNVIAGTRTVVSLLSLVGSLSIVISVLCRRQLYSTKVMPLFVLSIADFFLSASLIAGAVLWWTNAGARWCCLLLSLVTVVLVCASANLTVVYSGVCYSELQKKNLFSFLGYSRSLQVQRASRLKAAAVYACAWLLPFLIVIISFGSLEGYLHVMGNSSNCSCWCLPFFANVFPHSNPINMGTAHFFFSMKKVECTLGFIVGTNFMAVLVLLLFLYTKIFLHIKKMGRINRESTRDTYGSIDNLIFKGQRKAKLRILCFIVVFIVTGFANLVLSYALAINEVKDILEGEKIQKIPPGGFHDRLDNFSFTVYMLQSLTLPLQGFLNALVYGWTRAAFLEKIVYFRSGSHSKARGWKVDDRRLSYSGSYSVASSEDEK